MLNVMQPTPGFLATFVFQSYYKQIANCYDIFWVIFFMNFSEFSKILFIPFISTKYSINFLPIGFDLEDPILLFDQKIADDVFLFSLSVQKIYLNEN